MSGGQSGVDRAALDVALALGLECGGWCPAGRRAEDGPIDARYPLRETERREPEERTRRNVRDAEALLVLVPAGDPAGGTALAVSEARRLGRPLRVVALDAAASDPEELARTRAWLARFTSVNVAGPRESEAPGVAAAAACFLSALLAG